MADDIKKDEIEETETVSGKTDDSKEESSTAEKTEPEAKEEPKDETPAVKDTVSSDKSGKRVKTAIKGIPVAVSGVLLVAVIGVAIFAGAVFGVPFAKYLEGKSAMNSRDYQKAINLFSGLGDYLDCEELIIECRYDLAIIDFNEGNYTAAQSTLEDLGDVYDCEELLNRMAYDHAVELFEDGYIRRAMDELHDLGDYEGCSEMITRMTEVFREKNVFKYFAAVEEGDVVCFGNYEGTPLHWTILEVDHENYEVLMICDTYIGDMVYDANEARYDNCDIRRWLDTDFRQDAFRDDERFLMTYTHADGATSRFFFFNEEEASTYFADDGSRCNGFEYDWWLRPSPDSDTVPYVGSDGQIVSEGTSYTDELSMRPVVRLQVARCYWDF